MEPEHQDSRAPWERIVDAWQAGTPPALDPPPAHAHGNLAALATCAALALLALVLATAARHTVDTSPGRAEAATPPRPDVTLAWVGDMTLGSAYGQPPDHAQGLFAAVRPVLRAADLTLGNLEGTLSVGGASKCPVATPTCFAFQAPPANAASLRTAGFDLVNLANNHADDYGPSGEAQTQRALTAAGVRFTGAPGQVTLLRRGALRIAVVGFAAYRWAQDLRDIPAAQALIRAAARHADIVVALMHAGAEGAGQVRTPYGTEYGYGEDRGDTRSFAHAAIDAGADVVLGSGPHVVRGLETYRRRLIAYSLGNFAGDRNFGLGGTLGQSAILKLRLRPCGAVRAGRWIPVRLVDGGRPEPDPARGSVSLVRTLSAEDFPAYPRVRADGTFGPRRSRC